MELWQQVAPIVTHVVVHIDMYLVKISLEIRHVKMGMACVDQNMDFTHHMTQ